MDELITALPVDWYTTTERAREVAQFDDFQTRMWLHAYEKFCSEARNVFL